MCVPVFTPLLRRRRLFLAILIAGLVLGVSARAEPASYFDLSPEQLRGAEVISATKTDETVARTPAAVYVITAEDIARAGVTSIPDALRMAPGVNVAQTETGLWSISIRGFNRDLANQLLVMIDGRTLYNSLFAGTYWQLQNLPLEEIDRIEVIRGPGGTLWGANAVNGVINIITKRAQDTQGVTVRAAAGNYMRDNLLVRRGAQTEGGGYYRVYGQQLNYGSLDTATGGDGGQALNDTRAGFRYDRGNTLTVSGDAYTNRYSTVRNVVYTAAPYSSIEADQQTAQGANMLVNWRKSFDDGAQLQLRSYIDYTNKEQIMLGDQEGILDFDAQYNFGSTGRHEVIVGGGYRMLRQVTEASTMLAINPSANTLDLFNAFAQDRIILSDTVDLTLGTKLEHNPHTGFEYEPNARLQWFPDAKQTVWLSASRAVRTPSPFENELNLLAAVVPPNSGFGPLPLRFYVQENPGYDAEKIFAYEAGYRKAVTPDVSVDVAAFANFYKGLDAQRLVTFLAPVPTVNPDYLLLVTEQANIMWGETYGAEIAADWRVKPDWKLSGSFSMLRAFLHLNPGEDFFNQQARETYSPNFQGNLRSYWNVTDTVSLDTAVYYTGRLESLNIPAHVRADANLGWKASDSLELHLVGQNLFDNGHQEYGGGYNIPQTFYGKAICHF